MKIGTKVTLMYLGMSVCVLVGGYFLTYRSQAALRRDIVEDYVRLAKETMDKIDRHIFYKIEAWQVYVNDLTLQKEVLESNKNFENMKDIQGFIDEKDNAWTSVSEEIITDFMRQLMSNKLSEELREIIRFYDEKYAFKVFSEVFVTNKYGTNVGQTGKTTDYRQDDETWWQEAKENGFYVGDVQYDESTKIEAISISVRIEDENKNFIGVLKSVVNIEGIFNILKNLEPKKGEQYDVKHKRHGHNIHESMEFKLIDEKYQMIYSTEELGFAKKLLDELSFLLQRDLHESDFFIVADDKPGEGEELFAYAHSQGYLNFKGLDWVLIVEHETSEIFAPISKLIQNLFVIIILVAGCIIVLGVFFSHSVSVSIMKLRKFALAIGRGEFDVSIEIKAHDEIEDLVVSFNKMVAELRKTVVSKTYVDDIINNMADCLIVTNSKGKITLMNKAVFNILGYTEDELMGNEINILFSDKRISQKQISFDCMHEDVLLTSYEINCQTKEGRLIPVSLNVSSVKRIKCPNDGSRDDCDVFKKRGKHCEEFQGIIYTARDITESRRISQQLKQRTEEAESANRSKSQFLANMSHEIRTPMNAVIGYMDLLRDTSLSDVQKNFLEKASIGSNMLIDIIDDVLSLSKLESKEKNLEKIDFNLEYLIEDTFSILSSSLKGKPIKLSFVIENDILLHLEGDPSCLRIILMNLLSNAIKFTERGAISLYVKIEKQFNDENICLRFTVSDTGIGILKDKQDSIFNSFTQSDMSTTREYGGTGLGLAICKNYVQLMGGNIWVESEKGKGSRFVFTAVLKKCPRIKDVVGGRKSKGLSMTPHLDKEFSCEGIRILLAEDDPVNQELMKVMLNDIGCLCDIVENGKDALGKIVENRYDVVLMDMMMPVMGGLEASKIMRRNIKSEVPIVALTAAAMNEDRNKALASGINDYLTKPITKRKLKEILVKWGRRET